MSIQNKLLTEVDLTLVRTVKIAQGMEAADRNAQVLKVKENTVNLVRVATDVSHDSKERKFRDAECHNCEKQGHIAYGCQSKKIMRPFDSKSGN